MKIVFFGSPPFATPVLKKLKEKFEVVKVIDQSQDLKNQTLGEIQVLKPDVFVVASFGKLIPNEFLEVPRLGSINIHPSLLPKYRGPSPIQTAILNGDKITGVTFFKMDEEFDHGSVIHQFEEEIKDDDTFESLGLRLFEKATDSLEEVINKFSNDQTESPQDDSKATYTKLLTKEDGYIDLNKINPLEIGNWKLVIARRIRAYYPWPGVWTHFSLSSSGQAKTIKLLPNQQLQVEGRRPMSFNDFINGYANGRVFLEKLSLM